MKKSKGFTLIELLAVIVILGILLSVTTIAVNKIRKKQDKKNYQNVISSILTGAKQYATDNQISDRISVEKLLNSNYVDFDQSKYGDLKSKEVKVNICSGNIKRKFSIKIDDATTYNDCGCEKQDKNSVANELCKD